MAVTDIYTVSGSLIPSRHCLRFLGGNVDDGVTVNGLVTGAATSIVQGNHTHATITAWIMIPDITGTYCIFSMGDLNVAATTESLHFSVVAGKLQYYAIDGGVARVDVSTTNVVLTPFTWHHVAVVQNAVEPRFYVDGVMVTRANMTFTTSTELSQWADDLDACDTGCIGAYYGNNAYTNEFAGYISDVRVYSGTTSISALTAAQVKLDMNAEYSTLTTTLTGCRAHYTFDRDLANKCTTGPASSGGTIVGDIIYCDANEFLARFSFGCGTALVADKVLFAVNNNVGYAIVIQAA